MTLIEKYIGKTVLAAVGLVTLMLAGMQLFILFVNQLEDLGKAGFGITQALVFVLLQLPYQIYLFFPMASLLGCLIGLGLLASYSELTIMRAGGLSVLQITRCVFKTFFFVILGVTLLGETIIPAASRMAYDYKLSALSGGQAVQTAFGVWLRYKNNFILIEEVLPNGVLQDVSQFQFNEQNLLEKAQTMSRIVLENKQWVAFDVQQTEFFQDKTSTHQIKKMPWDVYVNPQILLVNGKSPDVMLLPQLYRYIQEQRKTHQNVSTHELALFQRMIQPFTTMVMMILAIPFIFGPLRSSTMGSKLLVGTTVGFGFHIINQFLGPATTVFQLPPILGALGPTLIFAFLGIYYLQRTQ